MVQWREGGEQEVYGWVHGWEPTGRSRHLKSQQECSMSPVMESYGTMVNYYGTMVVGFSFGSLSSTMVGCGH